jgi:hypothetical protein
MILKQLQTILVMMTNMKQDSIDLITKELILLASNSNVGNSNNMSTRFYFILYTISLI